MAGPRNLPVKTGTELPRYHYFEPAQTYERLDPFCEKHGVKLETIRRIVVEPVVRGGDVVSFRGEAPLFTYACGIAPEALARMAESIMMREGTAEKPHSAEAKMELWEILRDFSMGYGRPAEERIGLVTKRNLQEKFNLSTVNALATMRLWKNLSDTLSGMPQSAQFGEIATAYIDVWAENMGPESFSAAFNIFIQGRISSTLMDGSMLCISPTHCRSLMSPQLQNDTPYIVTTAKAEGALSIADLLPEGEAAARIRVDLLLWKKENTLVIADVTGSF